MIRTRVGYAGGRKTSPTYHSLGDHAETLQIDFDPRVTSYDELLSIFWDSHRPTRQSWSRQYMSAIFTANEDQAARAKQSMLERAEAWKREIFTELAPLEKFWLAEDYHQKYGLRHEPLLMHELMDVYDEPRFVDSTVAARLNGILSGHGDVALLDRELASYGLSAKASEAVRRFVERG